MRWRPRCLLGQLGGTLSAMFSAAPLSRLCTMLVARLREPGGRPADLRFGLSPEIRASLLTPLLVFQSRLGEARPERLRWAPGVEPQKNQGVFRVRFASRGENPAHFPGPSLGTLPKDVFLYVEFPFQRPEGQSCTESSQAAHA